MKSYVWREVVVDQLNNKVKLNVNFTIQTVLSQDWTCFVGLGLRLDEIYIALTGGNQKIDKLVQIFRDYYHVNVDIVIR